jgi:hypothetical protein
MLFEKHKAIVFVEEGKQQDVFLVCEEIRKKDKGFEWSPVENSFLLFDRNKDRLHKRALWLVKKVKGIKGYLVL